jgi:5-methylcytosine-specific restriction protein A
VQDRANRRRFQQGATAYNSSRWVAFSKRYRAEHPMCVNATTGLAGCTLVTDLVDHVHPHRGDEQAFWRGPFQPMCRVCHAAKTAREVGWSATGA